MSGYDVTALRAEFPILEREVHGKALVYLDNAATAHNPLSVLDASRRYYEEINSNIHRGTHHLAQRATAAHEESREKIATHLNAAHSEEIIFTSGTTEGINLVAAVLGYASRIGEGDAILITNLEHHSNTVPWQMLCERTGARLLVAPVLEDGTLDQAAWKQCLLEKPKVVAITQISNAFGTILDVATLTGDAHQAGALVLVDGAQAIPHLDVDVQALDVDFYVFSGHKAYAPTGIGILYGKREHLEALPPWKGGGEMIKKVDYNGTTYNDPPFKFEAGTPNIEGAIALGAALDFMKGIGLDALHDHESRLIQKAATELAEISGMKLYGPANRAGALSFNLEGIHHYDLGTLLDQMGVAVRTGHHCCQPLMARFNITGTIRASFACFNNEEDVDRLVQAVAKGADMLR